MDMLDFARYVAGLILVLGLLAGFAYILRRGYAQGLLPGFPGQGSVRRMRLVESLMIDPRRRVVIVEVDETEHVVLLGVAGETLLDSRASPPKAPEFEPDMPDSDPASSDGEGVY
ncbi:hypothetical protein GCM10011367_13200 [Marinicauda pacifica]|nr:hypothetical protein GCM10011367_13200 [Marinicauda pacifica]